jgi:hypothetical protein
MQMIVPYVLEVTDVFLLKIYHAVLWVWVVFCLFGLVHTLDCRLTKSEHIKQVKYGKTVKVSVVNLREVIFVNYVIRLYKQAA